MPFPPMEAAEGEEKVVNPRPRVAEIGEEIPDLSSLEVSTVRVLQKKIDGLFGPGDSWIDGLFRPEAFWSERYIVDPSDARDARSRYIRVYRDG